MIIRKFAGQHEDYVHDVSYDYYGKRLATCSSDHKIKIWKIDPKDGQFHCQVELEGHKGPVWRVTWAHPEFGNVIASCSYDRNVMIWEEHMGSTAEKPKWQPVATLVDSRESVIDVKFAPRHLGLKFATCSVDGYVRVYEASDIMNLTHWQIEDEFEADKRDVTSISWNPSIFDSPMLVVGSTNGNARLFGYNDKVKRWKLLVELQGHEAAVNDVCWAPNVGRSFHLIATVSSDRCIRIWKIERCTNGEDSWTSACVETLEQDVEVWRAQWNVTGTVLATSGDDGVIKSWQSNFRGKWECTSIVCGN